MVKYIIVTALLFIFRVRIWYTKCLKLLLYLSNHFEDNEFQSNDPIVEKELFENDTSLGAVNGIVLSEHVDSMTSTSRPNNTVV